MRLPADRNRGAASRAHHVHDHDKEAHCPAGESIGGKGLKEDQDLQDHGDAREKEELLLHHRQAEDSPSTQVTVDAQL